MKDSPLILEIKGNSLDDGPGIRTVVFFKGCPLDCSWCHNPESKTCQVELSYDAKQCIGCGACVDSCPQGAISKNHRFFVDRRVCQLCFTCADNCPSGAMSKAGRQIDMNDLLTQVMRDKPFYLTSGGGVTLSGGEPTLHMDFLSELLRHLHQNDVHTLLETCGHFNFNQFEQKLSPYIDTIYMDLKLFDPGEHEAHCGVGNQLILENFERLLELSRSGMFELLPRTPLVPGITDKKENLGAIAGFLKAHGVQQAKLLSYNPTWHAKVSMMGKDNPLADQAEMNAWMSTEDIQNCKDIFHHNGIEV